MSRLDELILKWLDGGLANEGLAEMNRLLADPANRVRLREELEFHAAIAEALAAANASDRVDGQAERFADTLAAQAMSRSERLRWWERWIRPQAVRPAWAWSAALAAMLLLAVGAWWLLGATSAADPAPRITAAMAGVTVQRGDGIFPAAAGVELRAGDLVRVPEGAMATVIYPGEASQLEVGSATRLVLGPWRQGKQWELTHGSIWVIAAPQPAGQPMRIATPHAEVRVIGTRFLVAALADRTRLEVEQGLVEIRRLGDPAGVEVGSGQFAEAGGAIRPRAQESPFEMMPVLADPEQTCLDDIDERIRYEGDWRARRHVGRFHNTEHETFRKGAAFVFEFTGTSVTLYGEKMPYAGTAMVYLDDEPPERIDYRAPPPGAWRQVVYTRSDLCPGPHTLKVVCNGDGWIYVDAIKYRPVTTGADQ